MQFNLRRGFCLLMTALICSATAARLRADDEKKPAYQIKIVPVKAQTTMTVRFRAKPEQLAKKWDESLSAVVQYVLANGGQLTGPPFGRYHSIKDGVFEVETGFTVAKAIKGNDLIKPSELPGGKAATTIHTGHYDKLPAAHEALHAWAAEQERKPTGGLWEFYLTDPGQEPDSTKWQTRLYMPIADETDEQESKSKE